MLGDIADQGKLDEQTPNFVAIENSEGFKKLIARKRAFLVPSIILFLSLYIGFNLLISYTDLLDKPFLGAITWVWVFSIGLFIMTWTLVTVYMRRSAQFDTMASETLKEFNYDGEANS
ncbi:hypothetical protein AU377_04680 [Sporosarcina sp. HYO08]|nr:hypothetical protein AU377_04680 [Sporosarcina sp. HYO08]